MAQQQSTQLDKKSSMKSVFPTRQALNTRDAQYIPGSGQIYVTGSSGVPAALKSQTSTKPKKQKKRASFSPDLEIEWQNSGA